MKSNERLVAALRKTIEIKSDIELGKFIRYIGSVSDLAYMSDDDISMQIEWANRMALRYPHDDWYLNTNPLETLYLDECMCKECPEADLYNFSKENEQIAYDRYKEKVKNKIFFEFTEKLDMSDFLKRFVLEYVEADDFKGITVINHRDVFLNTLPIEYRHMLGYVIGGKNGKYIAKYVYIVKNPCFGELMEGLLAYCRNDYDEFFGIALDWCESPRFTDYTKHIMYGLSYRNKEKVVEIYNEHQTIEKFHEYMQKANKITSEWKGVLYDDGTWED